MIATQSPSLLILGAHSDIARPLARLYAQDGYRVVLAARNVYRLRADAEDIRLRHGGSVDLEEFDVCDTKGHQAFLDRLGETPETVVTLVGLMTSQEEAEVDFAAAELMMRTNYIGLVSIIGEIANRMALRGSGTIIGVSSVAGDRGRSSNYIYGSSKAGFTEFLSGLRNRLFSKNVKVITVKPGYVRTQMTENLDLPAALTASAQELAQAIRSAQKKGRLVVYHRPLWRLIMVVIRNLPERIFVRTRL